MFDNWENIKMNPRVSLSFMDNDALLGYQLNGSVEIIDSGEECDDGNTVSGDGCSAACLTEFCIDLDDDGYGSQNVLEYKTES
jgi:cysteine-rich repeat protein